MAHFELVDTELIDSMCQWFVKRLQQVMDILKNKVHQEMTSSGVSPDPCVAATIEEQDADFNQVAHNFFIWPNRKINEYWYPANIPKQ